MKVLAAFDQEGNCLSNARIEKDKAELLAKHEQAKKDDPTWSMFGGMLYTSTGGEYQVAD
jgi:hypothetical protein